LQLVDGHTLFDYNVGLNEIIQILVRKPIVAAPEDSCAVEQSSTEESQSTAVDDIDVVSCCLSQEQSHS